MGKNPFCYHAKLGGGEEFANCSHLVATRTEAGARVAIHFLSNCGRVCWPESFHRPLAFLIVANISYNEANEGERYATFCTWRRGKPPSGCSEPPPPGPVVCASDVPLALGPGRAFLRDGHTAVKHQPRAGLCCAFCSRLPLKRMVFGALISWVLTRSPSPVLQKSKLRLLPHQAEPEDSTKFIVLTLISLVAIVGVLLASGVIYCLRHSSHHRLKEKLSGLGGSLGPDAPSAYQELCRQRMAVRTSERPEAPHGSRINSVSSQLSDGPMPSPSARSSTSSWSEEPVQPNMDISTGHMVLAYMEDHLKNKNRLEKEWEALCAYQAEPNSSLVAQQDENVAKNRCPAVLTYDHSRIRLNSENSHSSSDYINASPIMDHDPRKPAYIATQGPLPATVADFWQMVWESGCAVIVMLTSLSENGVGQCYHYWPDEGANLYHVYEVNLVSEHIWCEDFLVRSFYLKNLQTSETRTVTQFHFLSWYDQGVPSSARSLLDFRRKVNKCYRGRSCPIIVHCSDGAGRSGTYVLIDMVLNKMAKGKAPSEWLCCGAKVLPWQPGCTRHKKPWGELACCPFPESEERCLQQACSFLRVLLCRHLRPGSHTGLDAQ
uniref:Protein tyrosine phosphatase receptor type N2 n=1 Tax=Sus scrofa TaxID=9823 RepID=A0A8D1DIS5_PIG